MSEKKLIIDQLKLTYEGLFDLPGLYRLIDEYFYDKGYDKRERLNSELVLPTGRSVKIETNHYKNLTDYFKIVTRIRIYGSGIRRPDIDQNGAKLTLNEGKLMLIFDGYVISDRFDRWERTPFLWFMRTLFDKYIFKGHYLRAEQWLMSDAEDLTSRIKSFLNVYRYRGRDVLTAHVLG